MQPIVVLYLLWVLWFLTWLAVAIAGDPGPHKVRGPILFLYRLAIVAATLLLFTITPWPGLDVQYRFWDRALSEEAGWALTAVAALGFVLAWWGTIARLIAGKRQDGAVDRGPYRFVPHPVYLGLMLAALATAATFGRPSSLAGAVLFAAAFLTRILLEEHPLHNEEPAVHERVPMFKGQTAPLAHVSVRPVPEPRRVELTIISAETPEPEIAPEAPAKPVQLKLSLDVSEKNGQSALSEIDLKP